MVHSNRVPSVPRLARAANIQAPSRRERISGRTPDPDLGPKIEVCDDTTLESELTEQNSHQNFGVIIKDRDTRHEVKMKGSSQGLKVKPVYHPLLQVKLHLVRFFRPFQRCPALYFYRQGQAFKLSTEPLHSFQEVFGLETSHFQQFKCPPPPSIHPFSPSAA